MLCFLREPEPSAPNGSFPCVGLGSSLSCLTRCLFPLSWHMNHGWCVASHGSFPLEWLQVTRFAQKLVGSSDLGRRGPGKGDPRCPQLTAARSSTAPLGSAQGCRAHPLRARGCSLAKGLGIRTPPLEAETPLLSRAGAAATLSQDVPG